MNDKQNKLTQNAYINAFRKRTYDRITIQIRKDNDIISRLETQKILTGKSLNSLIIEAIEEFLKRREK